MKKLTIIFALITLISIGKLLAHAEDQAVGPPAKTNCVINFGATTYPVPQFSNGVLPVTDAAARIEYTNKYDFPIPNSPYRAQILYDGGWLQLTIATYQDWKVLARARGLGQGFTLEYPITDATISIVCRS